MILRTEEAGNDAGRKGSHSIFEPYYSEMEQMIHDEMKAHGIEYFYEDEDEDEEDDEE